MEEAAPAFQELKIRPLANRILLAYLKERCIDVETARKNMPGDFLQAETEKIILPLPFPIFPVDMRCGTDFLKACISPKDITCVTNGQEMGRCYVFEGFMDYLSFEPAFPLWPKGGLLGAELRQQLAEGFFLSFTI